MTDSPLAGSQLVLRPMQLEDVPQVHAIDQVSFSLPWSERSFRFEVCQNTNARPWVAEMIKGSARHIVAMMVLWVILDEAHLATIAVHPQYRRQKLAQKLLATALLTILPLGIKMVLLEVRKSNQSAQALYRRFGFEEVGVRPRYYQDNQEDAVLMTLFDPQSKLLRRLAFEVVDEA